MNHDASTAMAAGQTDQTHRANTMSGSMSHYPSPPPLLQPSPSSHYGRYGYIDGTNSLPTAIPSRQPVLPPLGTSAQPGMSCHYSFDTAGQHPPPRMKPRVETIFWETEGILCLQVEARSIRVASRDDDGWINGTKLLNVAKMKRGRRDGILKNENPRRVVKAGPMDLKGVWIPPRRALHFAQEERIYELVWPLFEYSLGVFFQKQDQKIHGHPAGLSSIQHPAPPGRARRNISQNPAKTKSKWSQDEDALLLELRGSGTKWEDIAKRISGRSAVSCRLHYQNYPNSANAAGRQNPPSHSHPVVQSPLQPQPPSQAAVPLQPGAQFQAQPGTGSTPGKRPRQPDPGHQTSRLTLPPIQPQGQSPAGGDFLPSISFIYKLATGESPPPPHGHQTKRRRQG